MEQRNKESEIREEKCTYGFELGDRYVIRSTLGKGASGTVFLAYDNRLNKCWAVKACKGKTRREIEALKAIDHFAFPRIVDVVEQDETTFLIMDYIEGETLEKYCRKHAVSEKQVLLWGRKASEALYYLHSCSPTLIYMDCKPENIMITPGGEIRLIDLGSILVCDNEKDKTVSGTNFYAPTEAKQFGLHNKADFKEFPDERSDIYSLGMTMYYLLLGRKTEYRDRRGKLCLRRYNRNIGRLTEYVIQRCTSTGKNERYQSMKDLERDIRIVLGKSPQKLGLWRRCLAVPVFMKMADISFKIILSLLILYFAGMIAGGTENRETVCCALLLLAVTFVLTCRSRTVYSWENRKSVYRGMGAKMLLLAVIMLGGLEGNQTQAAERTEETTAGETDGQTETGNRTEENSLGLVLYDEEGRRLLVKPGYVWNVTGDIFMSLDEEEVVGNPCKITVICENGEETRLYSYMCQSSGETIGVTNFYE